MLTAFGTKAQRNVDSRSRAAAHEFSRILSTGGSILEMHGRKSCPVELQLGAEGA